MDSEGKAPMRILHAEIFSQRWLKQSEGDLSFADPDGKQNYTSQSVSSYAVLAIYIYLSENHYAINM